MRILSTLIAGFVALFSAIGCGGNTAPASTVGEKIVGGALIIDVRSSGEFVENHYDGALNIPVDELGSRTAELGDKARPIVVYCRSGHRSARAAATLRAAGFTDVTDAGGLSRMPPR